MRSICVMAAANIRKRKAQSLLILITILLAALLLASAIQLLSSLDDPVARMFQEQKASQLTLQFSCSDHNPTLIQQWWQRQPGVEQVNTYPYHMVTEKVRHNQILKSMGSLMITGCTGQTDQDLLVPVVASPGQSGTPDKDGVWVPTGFAYTWGIGPGDIIAIPLNGVFRELTVTAIVIDPQFSPSMMSPVRLWVNPYLLQELFPQEHSLSAMVGIRLSDYSLRDNLWPRFEEYLGTPFLGYNLDYESVQYMYTVTESIIGVILLLFSVIIILVSAFVIFFTIHNAVMSDYKIIGILGAQGFSSMAIKTIYVFQYFLLAAVAIPLGILASKPVVGKTMFQMQKSLGLAKTESSLLLPAAITAAILLLAICVTALISAGKASSVKPAQAIRSGAPDTATAKQRFNLTTRSLPVSVLLGIKNTVTGKRHSLFQAAAAATMAFVLTFAVNAYNSVGNMGENLAYWGFDAAEVIITGRSVQSLDHVAKTITEDPRVQAAATHSVLLTAIPAQNGIPSTNVVAFAYGGEMDSMGAVNLEGRNPQAANEVCLSVLAAREFGKTVGDTVKLFLEGKTDTYLVTGIYQTLNGMGWGFKVVDDAVLKANPDFSPKDYLVKLVNGADPNEFAQDMQHSLGSAVSISTTADSGELNLSAIADSMALAAAVLSVVFMAIASIITFNTTLMSIYGDKKSFGIYKALGMTPLQIRMSLVWKALVLSVTGVALGLPLALFISPRVLSMLLTGVGMLKFPFAATPWGTALVIPVCILVALISTWIPSGRVLKLNPRNLIID